MYSRRLTSCLVRGGLAVALLGATFAPLAITPSAHAEEEGQGGCHGAAVSAIAHSAEHGRGHGPAVREAAHNHDCQGLVGGGVNTGLSVQAAGGAEGGEAGQHGRGRQGGGGQQGAGRRRGH